MRESAVEHGHPLKKAFLFRTAIQHVTKCFLVQMM